ncbi:flagellin [Acutalibacter intestini]|uniref:flagellin N-terminal helical domain-containing protein n=1 Tax=Acutalibacter intestini TaxID=3093659 RepID=UPI002AC8BA96|nr:flagellin [Acutalibacter sp. M00204]
MRIQHNIMAMNAYRNYNTNTSALSKNLEKLSSGYKINRAGDDAAGLAISEKMRAQITGLNAAQKNVKDGISLVKTAEGAMQEIQDMLNRMDYLATQSANGTYDNEVDRLNLQKEVDALKSEINRIADSANFNGIKLLDGKAGVNTTAFTEFKNVDGVKGHNGTVDIPAASWGTTGTGMHTEGAGAKQVNAEAVVDLSGVTISAAAAGDTVTATLNILGQDIDISLTGDTSYDKSDIATAVLKKLETIGVDPATGAKDTTTANNNTAIKVGDNVYNVTADTDGIKLTLAGTFKNTTYTAVTATPTDATNDFDAAAAEQINKDLGSAVTLSGITGASGSSGDAVHMTTKVTQAVAHKGSSLAGIDLKLDSTMVADGNVLEIDGKKFVFQTDATESDTVKAAVADGAVKIDVSAGADDAAKVHLAADKLSQQTKFTGTDGREWKIGSKGTDTIHFEQVKATDAGAEKLDSADDIKSKIKVTGTPTTDKGAGVAITTDIDKVAVGNKLTFTLGDKSVTLEVVESGADASKHQINKADIADATKLQAALGSDYTAEVANGTKANEKIITVRSKLTTTADAAAVAASKAPIVSGTGLTLQIGDTSDSYNQLGVKIGDMHTSALGIDKLDISNPEGASAAIQTVRDAINYVSGVRGDLGAAQNRLEHTANNLSVMAENIQDAESTIRDTDVAEEMMAYTKNNILIQSAQAMLAQANAVPQGVLQLLG